MFCFVLFLVQRGFLYGRSYGPPPIVPLSPWRSRSLLCSSFSTRTVVYQAVEERAGAGSPLPELFQGHGTGDELVFHKWGGETTAVLKKAEMTTTFHSFQGLQHQLFRPEIELLRSWTLTKLLPDPHQAAPGSSPSCSRILTKLLPDSLDASGQ